MSHTIKDPIADEIIKEATAIRVLCGNSDTFPDAWTISQLNQMLGEIQAHAERVLSLAGVHDVEDHYILTIEKLSAEVNLPNVGYIPYSETD
jgi:hypothetical protein